MVTSRADRAESVCLRLPIAYDRSFTPSSMKPRVFSGIQPSGNLHIGNYLGALKNWVRMQHDYESIYCIVDLHAITVYQEPNELLAKIREIAALFLAAGIDPKVSSVIVQSAVPAHAELAWMLTCVTPMGWLSRMTQFKAKSEKQETVGDGLLAIPGADGRRHPALSGGHRAGGRRPVAAPGTDARHRAAIQLALRRDVRGSRHQLSRRSARGSWASTTRSRK